MAKIKNFRKQDLTYAQKIEYFANLNDFPTINNNNGKTGKAVATLSMPPKMTCRPDAPCYKSGKCYCMKGHQTYASVLGSYYKNWRLWNEDPKLFEEKVTAYIKYSGLKMIRWHDAGEIANMAYLKMMVNIANNLPDVKFLAYTKKYDLVNSYLDVNEKLPDNLTIRFSYWDKDWTVRNPHDVPRAYVDFKDKTLNPEFPDEIFHCEGTADPDDMEHTCGVCQECFKKETKAVIFKQH